MNMNMNILDVVVMVRVKFSINGIEGKIHFQEMLQGKFKEM